MSPSKSLERVKCARCQLEKLQTLIRSYFAARMWLQGAEINPFRVIWLNPEMIFRRSSSPVPKKHYKITSIRSGGWDLTPSSFRLNALFESLQQRFEEGKTWRETPYYETAMEKIRDGHAFWQGSSTIHELNERCVRVDSLYASIRDEGYKVPHGVEEFRSGISASCRPEEVKVSIGRSGEFMLQTGRHRLSIALILGIDLIPVQVAVRHNDWQELRNKFIKSKLNEALIEELSHHPDLAYL